MTTPCATVHGNSIPRTTRRDSRLSYPLAWPETIDLWTHALRHVLRAVALPRSEPALTCLDEISRTDTPAVQTSNTQTSPDASPSRALSPEHSADSGVNTNVARTTTTTIPTSSPTSSERDHESEDEHYESATDEDDVYDSILEGEAMAMLQDPSTVVVVRVIRCQPNTTASPSSLSLVQVRPILSASTTDTVQVHSATLKSLQSVFHMSGGQQSEWVDSAPMAATATGGDSPSISLPSAPVTLRSDTVYPYAENPNKDRETYQCKCRTCFCNTTMSAPTSRHDQVCPACAATDTTVPGCPGPSRQTHNASIVNIPPHLRQISDIPYYYIRNVFSKQAKVAEDNYVSRLWNILQALFHEDMGDGYRTRVSTLAGNVTTLNVFGRSFRSNPNRKGSDSDQEAALQALRYVTPRLQQRMMSEAATPQGYDDKDPTKTDLADSGPSLADLPLTASTSTIAQSVERDRDTFHVGEVLYHHQGDAVGTVSEVDNRADRGVPQVTVHLNTVGPVTVPSSELARPYVPVLNHQPEAPVNLPPALPPTDRMCEAALCQVMDRENRASGSDRSPSTSPVDSASDQSDPYPDQKDTDSGLPLVTIEDLSPGTTYGNLYPKTSRVTITFTIPCISSNLRIVEEVVRQALRLHGCPRTDSHDAIVINVDRYTYGTNKHTVANVYMPSSDTDMINTADDETGIGAYIADMLYPMFTHANTLGFSHSESQVDQTECSGSPDAQHEQDRCYCPGHGRPSTTPVATPRSEAPSSESDSSDDAGLDLGPDTAQHHHNSPRQIPQCTVIIDVDATRAMRRPAVAAAPDQAAAQPASVSTMTPNSTNAGYPYNTVPTHNPYIPPNPYGMDLVDRRIHTNLTNADPSAAAADTWEDGFRREDSPGHRSTESGDDSGDEDSDEDEENVRSSGDTPQEQDDHGHIASLGGFSFK